MASARCASGVDLQQGCLSRSRGVPRRDRAGYGQPGGESSPEQSAATCRGVGECIPASVRRGRVRADGFRGALRGRGSLSGAFVLRYGLRAGAGFDWGPTLSSKKLDTAGPVDAGRARRIRGIAKPVRCAAEHAATVRRAGVTCRCRSGNVARQRASPRLGGGLELRCGPTGHLDSYAPSGRLVAQRQHDGAGADLPGREDGSGVGRRSFICRSRIDTAKSDRPPPGMQRIALVGNDREGR